MKTTEKFKLEKLLRKELGEKRRELGITDDENSYSVYNKYAYKSDRDKKKDEIEEKINANIPTNATKLWDSLIKAEKIKDKIQEELTNAGWIVNNDRYNEPPHLKCNDYHPEIVQFEKDFDKVSDSLNEVEKQITLKVWAEDAEMEKVFADFQKMMADIKI